jgi:uncharacterized protein with ATP-grasp and redox domains
MKHLGRAGQLPCTCNKTGTCTTCQIQKAATQLEKVWQDDTKRAGAVHDLIATIKEAAKK